MINLVVFLAFGVNAVAGQVDERRANKDVMKGIIQNVLVNEQLYRNLEAVTQETYRSNPAVTERLPISFDWAEFHAKTVYQGNFFYFRRQREGKTVAGEASPEALVQGYDGNLTRSVVEKMAKIHSTRVEACQSVFRPHTWMLEGADICMPLSMWLDPNTKVYDTGVRKINFQGEETVNGIDCVKIRYDHWIGEKLEELGSRYDLWLATEKNYLPVKLEGYATLWSTTTPAGVGITTEFREIGPGVWLPFRYNYVRYDSLQLKEGRRVWGYKQEGSVTLANLHPKYDVSLFRDIPIPDGTVVYEFKDGVKTRSYIKGSGNDEMPSFVTLWHVILLVSLVLLVSFVGFTNYTRWKRKRGSSEIRL